MVRTNTFSILSLIFAFIFFPLGFVFGIVALSQIKRSKEEGEGLAIAGIIVSCLPLIILMLLFLMLIFTGTTNKLDGGLSDCQDKGGVCVLSTSTCPQYTLHSLAFSCKNNDNKCCLGSPRKCVDNNGCNQGVCKEGFCYS